MLPLTRNIFRQTATSFNNTTKGREQESYFLHLIKVIIAMILDDLQLSINKIKTSVRFYTHLEHF